MEKYLGKKAHPVRLQQMASYNAIREKKRKAQQEEFKRIKSNIDNENKKAKRAPPIETKKNEISSDSDTSGSSSDSDYEETLEIPTLKRQANNTPNEIQTLIESIKKLTVQQENLPKSKPKRKKVVKKYYIQKQEKEKPKESKSNSNEYLNNIKHKILNF